MTRSRRLLPLVVLLSLMTQSFAAHITDKLVVGLYESPKAEGSPLELLTSGTPVEVLRRKDGFAEVRVNNDKTGWVETGYLTEEKPAKAMLLETQARLRQMGLELAKLREQSGESSPVDEATPAMPLQADTAELEAALDQSNERIATLEAALAEREAAGSVQQQLDRVNDQVRATLEDLAETQGLVLSAKVPEPAQSFVARYLPWLIGALALALGFTGGIVFLDRRIRRRFRGLRL